MTSIEKLRVELNGIDQELVALLEKRFTITEEIGKIKKEHNIEIEDLKREKEIFDRIKNWVENPCHHESIKKIYQALMVESKARQL